MREGPLLLRSLLRSGRSLAVREGLFMAEPYRMPQRQAVVLLSRRTVSLGSNPEFSQGNVGVPWEAFQRMMDRFPLQQSKLRLPFREWQALTVL